MENWEWDFHTAGDEACDACAVEPTHCLCGGLVHTHFLVTLDAIKGRCDQCHKAGVPEPVEVE